MEREWEQLLVRVLTASIEDQTYGRAVIEVVLQVIQDDGSVLAAALHAAVAALIGTYQKSCCFTAVIALPTD